MEIIKSDGRPKSGPFAEVAEVVLSKFSISAGQILFWNASLKEVRVTCGETTPRGAGVREASMP